MTSIRVTAFAVSMALAAAVGAQAAEPPVRGTGRSPVGSVPPASSSLGSAPGPSLGSAPGTSLGAPTGQSLGAAPGTSVGGGAASSQSLGAAPGTTLGGHQP